VKSGGSACMKSPGSTLTKSGGSLHLKLGGSALVKFCSYYQKRKRAGDRAQVFNLFPSPPVIQTKPNLTQSAIPVLFLLGVALLTSGYLIGEMGKFFLESEPRASYAFYRAVLVELLTITFLLISFGDTFSRVMRVVILGGLCFYSLWAVSSGVVMTGSQTYNESTANQKLIEKLETQIRDTDSMTQTLLSREWISAARKSQAHSDVLKEKLNVLISKSAELRPPSIVLNSVLNSVLMRLILMISNIFVLRRLKEIVTGAEIRFKTRLNLIPVRLAM
jgi:hypothetical protein